MLHQKWITVVLPAYKAELTLERTYRDIPKDVVDAVLLVDDASTDRTVDVAHRLGIPVIVHPKNRGYGGNQKTCYQEALDRGADIVVMLHPDYQYEPKLITPMAAMVASGVYDIVLGSRILGNTARGRHARVQVLREPPADVRREPSLGDKALGVSHGLPRLLPRGAGEVAFAGELRRFRI